MGAPKGNQFWKLRSKHGRDKLFATPELLWEAACEYFEWCEENPLYETQVKVVGQGQGAGSSTELVELPVMRAMTLSQLCFYLGCSESYFRAFKSTLTEKDKDFLTVISDIELTVYNQKFQGAAANLLNANLISRDLGLAERTDVTISDAPDIIAPGKKKD